PLGVFVGEGTDGAGSGNGVRGVFLLLGPQFFDHVLAVTDADRLRQGANGDRRIAPTTGRGVLGVDGDELAERLMHVDPPGLVPTELSFSAYPTLQVWKQPAASGGGCGRAPL